jgi:hypothetical protein
LIPLRIVTVAIFQTSSLLPAQASLLLGQDARDEVVDCESGRMQ